MTLKLIWAAASALALGLLAASAAVGAPIVVNFDSMSTSALVNAYYDGGTNSLGQVGPNYGVTFTPGDWLTDSGFGQTSQPNFAVSLSGSGAVDVAGGFTSLAFTFGDFTPTTVSVYSGFDGGGALLGSLSGLSASPYAFAPASLSFSGLAHSIVISGGVARFGWDDLILGQGVPEPASWATILAGLGFVGGVRRAARRRPTISA